MQVYRVLGATFLIHYHAGQIPREFALPAGYGDVLVGALAIPVALYVHGDPSRRRWAAITWNVLGIFDLVQAVSLGFLTAPGRFQLLGHDLPNHSIGAYPLVTIPTFAVPLSLGLHVLSLWQLRRAARAGLAQ